MARTKTPRAAPARDLTVGAVALRDKIRQGSMTSLGRCEAEDVVVEVLLGRDSLWAFVRRPGKGALALRCAHAPGGGVSAERIDGGRWRMKAATGVYDVELGFELAERPVLHCKTTLTPAVDLLIPFLPRDLYPLSDKGDPLSAEGEVEAAQRGLNSGLVFLTLNKPAFGAALYFQNFTALNPYFEALDTKPDGVVGGKWPELGYLPPAAPIGHSPPTLPLKKGVAVVVSDTFLALEADLPNGEHEIASLFIELIASIYPHLDRPTSDFHDWPGRARATLRDLSSPKATIEHYGHTYLHPYTASEYPDSMVQMSVLAALAGYDAWTGEPSDIRQRLGAGLGRFYDKELGAIRRYLPNVGDDKDAEAVDSWYLYHPLVNLGRLAFGGDAKAKSLFADSLDFAIKAARHFHYVWPIQFKVDTFEVIVESRNDEGLGQTDVGGLYCYLMVQAYELLSDQRYLDEAVRAVAALRDCGFDLAYQMNLTAWGAVGCLKLWRITGDEDHRAQSYVFLASFLHNSPMWESNLKLARHYRNFFGVTCLHDGPYMAMYEEFEAAGAFDEYLLVGKNDLPPSVRMLLAEWRRYALDRTWYYYPDALPPEAVAQDDIRNGHIDRKLSFPLEDLYMDGQPAGQVGQEIYGCGAAFVFAMHCFQRLRDAPFLTFCEYPLQRVTNGAKGFATLVVDGSPDFTCGLRINPHGGPLKGVKVSVAGRALTPKRIEEALEFQVAGGDEVQLSW